MSDKTKEKCERPEKLESDPRKCSPEQIKECHGDVKKHPCTSTVKK